MGGWLKGCLLEGGVYQKAASFKYFKDLRSVHLIVNAHQNEYSKLIFYFRIGGHAADILQALLKLIVDCGDMEDVETRGIVAIVVT